MHGAPVSTSYRNMRERLANNMLRNYRIDRYEGMEPNNN